MSVPSTVPRPIREDIEALIARLADEMAARWQRGERPPAEHFLDRHPELWQEQQAAADLIYEEVCLRQELGEEVATEEILRRFPQWRQQLELLLRCQQLLGRDTQAPRFPEVGATLGEFRLLAELGRGARGRVFLATQTALGDRPVVLKLTPCDGREHLSLARLQHTHIVPLYAVHDDPERGLRALCMPYFGGATLADLLDALQPVPLTQRTGKDLVAALDRLGQSLLAPPAVGPAREVLAGIDYVQAICWIGLRLAEALQYAHQRGLVHLDLKPSNVLLAADGQPMLLDFHLAQPALQPDGPAPTWLGGTPAYMSREQQAALVALESARPLAQPVDARSDVYSLGVVLYEALAGALPVLREKSRPLRRCNPAVSPGLSDVIGKCLANEARARYPDAAALAADLERHLAHLPLQGVRNRSWTERWHKWRQRRPHALALSGMLLAVVAASAAVGIGAWGHFRAQADQAQAALLEARSTLEKHRYAEAADLAQRGIGLAGSLPGHADLLRELQDVQRLAAEGQAATRRDAAVRELHALADRVRFLYGMDALAASELRRLEACCRTLWDQRALIQERLGDAQAPLVRSDLIDLAVLWADLHVRLASAEEVTAARKAALHVLDEAESLGGAGPVLRLERQLHTAALESPEAPQVLLLDPDEPPRTAWEHYAVGRCLLRAGQEARAAVAFAEAVRLQPGGVWPHFYQGVCAHRMGRYEDAVTAFSTCIGAAPAAAACYYNRGLAYAALGRRDRARTDYDSALTRDPSLGAALLNRGLLHYQEKRHAEALADLRLSLEHGVSPSLAHYDLALVHLARGERAEALASLQAALQHDPQHAEARKLLAELRRRR